MRRLPLLALWLAHAVAATPVSGAEGPDAAQKRLEARIAALEGELQACRGAAPSLVEEPNKSHSPGSSQSDSKREVPGTEGFYVCLILALSCVSMAALAAGLTMGLVSLDPMELQMLEHADDKDVPGILEKKKLKQDKEDAKKVLPLISDHHRLLVTLLLMNSVANEALPLFLDKLVPSWLAVMLSVSLVLMFGEILPSAVFTGSEQLKYASKFTGLVSCCQTLLLPIVWPIAKVLDLVLGEDHKPRYNFSQLRAMVGLHVKNADKHQIVELKSTKGQEYGIITAQTEHHLEDDSVVVYKGSGVPGVLRDGQTCYVKPCPDMNGRNKGVTFELYSEEDRQKSKLITFQDGVPLTDGRFEVMERDEHKIMRGITEITHMKVSDPSRMKSLDQVNMLDLDTVLNKEKLVEIDQMGHSRLPVYSKSKHNIRGFILVKHLIVYDPNQEWTVLEFEKLMSRPVVVNKDTKMLDLLNKFQADRKHFALVCDQPEKVLKAWEKDEEIPCDVHMAGILTLEDVFEQLLQEDIDDETEQIQRRRSFWNDENAEAREARQLSRKQSDKTTVSSTPSRGPAVSYDLEQPLLDAQAAGSRPLSRQGTKNAEGCSVA